MPVSRRLRIQRMGLLLYGGLGVMLLIYTLGFITDVYIFFAYGNRELAGFYRAMQGINSGLLRNSLLLIVCALVLFVLELWRHAAGIITFLITAVVSALGVLFSVTAVLDLYRLRLEYSGLDLSSLNRYIERGTIAYSPSTLTYDLGIALHIIFFCASVFLIAAVLANARSGEDRNEAI